MDAKVQSLYKAALTSQDYRAFLNGAFTAHAETSRTGKFNYAAFARKAGFQSRGFAQEVISGRKRLTSQSYPKFVKGLALPALLKQYFNLLVAKEEPELNSEKLSPEKIEKSLADLRQRIQAELKLSSREKDLAQFLQKHTHLLSVYAVLGNREVGATLENVSRRTGLHPAVCERVLEHMVHQNVVEERYGRFYSVNPLLIFKGANGNQILRSTYFETLEDMKRKATANFEHPEQLFLHAYFSVDRKRLPELKKKLWDVVAEFIDENDHDDGDCVGKLLLGMFT